MNPKKENVHVELESRYSMDLKNIDIKNLACFICEFLKNNGIEAILVGGACVSIYSHNKYQSYDLDFVTYDNLKSIEKILSKIGFKRIGRCFKHHSCPYLLDFVNPPIAVGNQLVSHFETLKTPSGSLQLLTATDCVKDRLSSFFYWDDEQALEQALIVAKDGHIEIEDVKKWSKNEGHLDKFNIFLHRFMCGK